MLLGWDYPYDPPQPFPEDAIYGEDELVVIYWHSRNGGVYYTTEARNRQLLYPDISAHPTCKFDAVQTYVGGGGSTYNAYMNIINSRLAVDTPITIRSKGLIGDTEGWVEATFKTEEPIAGTLQAHFVLIEKVGEHYNWTSRDHLPWETVTLAAAGDSVTVYREFTITSSPWPVIGDLDVVVFIEDTSPHLVYNAQFMPDPYVLEAQSPSYAEEILPLETATYSMTVKNIGTIDDTVTVAISEHELPPGLDLADWEANYRLVGGSWMSTPSEHTILIGETLEFELRVVDTVGDTEGMAVTTLTATSNGDADVDGGATFATFVGLPSVLLVDDDGGETWETYLQTALADTGYAARHWDVMAEGRPGEGHLTSYWAVVWTTGTTTTSLGRDQDKLMAYLDGGGNLYLSSMGFLNESLSLPNTFVDDYLHIDAWNSDNGGFFMTGVAGDEISDGMNLGMLGSPIPPGGIDSFTRTAPADTIFYAANGSKGLKVEEAGHKIVFTAFPFENVKTATAAPSNAKTLIGRIMDWFGTPAAGVDGGSNELGRLALKQNFPNPFNPVTKLEFSIPAGVEHVSLVVHNVNGQVVRTLVDGRMTAGPHAVVWDGTDESGESLSSGVYFARLTADGEKAFTKMTLLK
jgi:hypothetical protein